MKKTKQFIKAGAEKELAYCKAKIESGSPLEHWKIRVAEIEKQLKGKKK